MPELPGINQAAGLRQMMNKISLYQRVLRDFHARFQNETAQIQSALLAGDFDVVKRRVHSAKGLAATIGAHELQEAARRLEQALIGTSDAAESALIDFDQALKKVIDGIDAAFAISRSTSTKH
jgi:HPt (histidine-containing phosphotransfer) domain-containing protein